MKKLIKITAILTIILFGFAACSEDYFDVNTPANAVDIGQLDMKDLMGPVLYNTMMAQYSTTNVFGNYSQYFGGYGNQAAGRTDLSGTWNYVYLYILPNVRIIKEKAAAQDAKYYEAVALVIEAANIGLATDSWDAIPYAEASKPSQFPHPDFDSQEQIYNEIFTLLNQAIQLLEGADNSFIGMGNEDLIYQGDFNKWLRAAYTLKARYQLHLVQKGITTPNDVLASIANGFTSNSDNFLMNFPDDKLNPWYQNAILTRNTGNYYVAPNDQIISMMNGTTYPFESDDLEIDPRLPIIYQNEGAAGSPWRGAMNGGDGSSSDGEPSNTYYKEGGYFTNATSPLILITYAEAMFIKAEAGFLANGGTTTSTGANGETYAAYTMGINASMEQYGADGATYLADGAVDVGEAGLMLNHIMKEKYITNILNSETYNDFRRYNFSEDVFKDLALRLEDDDTDSDYKGQWFRRAIYPVSEKNANPDVVAKYEQEPTVDVWWAN